MVCKVDDDQRAVGDEDPFPEQHDDDDLADDDDDNDVTIIVIVSQNKCDAGGNPCKFDVSKAEFKNGNIDIRGPCIYPPDTRETEPTRLNWRHRLFQ